MTHADAGTLDTLFYPFRSGVLAYPQSGDAAVFFNAHQHQDLSRFQASGLILQQYFKPYHDALAAQGHAVQTSVEVAEGSQDYALILLPKNKIEAVGLIATAFMALKAGGVLVAAAANKAGGARLVKTLQSFGIGDVLNDTRNKARVVWVKKDGVDEEFCHQCIEAASVRQILDGAFHSWPGIYGWDKMDQGSAFLLQHLPDNLSGKGADFGCGYGVLAHHVLQHNEVSDFTCFDADWRCLDVAKKNLEAYKNVGFEWTDLTRDQPSGAFDFIVMNPPFHEGKTTDSGIGKAFIHGAFKALKAGGSLWMVANRHLPYEHDLSGLFASAQKVAEGQGFKIFCAKK